MRKLLLAGAVLVSACGSEEQLPEPPPAPNPTTTAPELTTTTTEAIAAVVDPVEEVVETTVEVATTLRVRTTTTTTEYLQPQTTTPVVESSTEWAIPTYIVMCESGGDWNAYNASGASGPYQLMPMHFGGELAMNQSRAAQHAKAAELWDGGRGKRHWEACL